MADNKKKINFVADVKLNICVELGRTPKLFKDILKIKKNDIIPLPTKTGDRLNFLVNDKLIAKGEVMVIQGKYALRITDIVGKIDKPGAKSA